MKLCFHACTIFSCIGYREVMHGAVLSITGLTFLLLSTSTVSKTAFLIFAGSELCLHELHKASTVVEMALSDHPGT